MYIYYNARNIFILKTDIKQFQNEIKNEISIKIRLMKRLFKKWSILLPPEYGAFLSDSYYITYDTIMLPAVPYWCVNTTYFQCH